MELDVQTLALFVGFAAADRVQDALARQGYGDLRFSHGFVFQHLIEGEPTIGELAARLAVTQQAASKTIAELESLGYTERVPDPADARIRRVRLTSRGRMAIDAARQARATLEAELLQRVGDDALATTRACLHQILNDLDALPAVHRRDIRPPR
ncbi:MarR family winged helix-turn-helix transcriptional regulator [Actinomadura sp. 6N118]|uniref:MarR family winged helix-turn-helix transcriptional regulator n=1 Tax=Actinomadura sp. 6N118 TaxID=3375151 RepID=UPI003794CA1D